MKYITAALLRLILFCAIMPPTLILATLFTVVSIAAVTAFAIGVVAVVGYNLLFK